MEFARYPSLAGRVVLITGGASGIGADMVRAFAANGCRVAFIDIQPEPAAALVAECAASGGEARFYPCDLRDIGALGVSIARIREDLGPVSVLLNNAANDDRHDADAVTLEYWDNCQAVNLRHQFFAAQQVRAHMREFGRGSIINMSSIAWRGGGGDMSVYATAKAAVIGLTRSLGRAFGDDNIRVNAIEPGAVITERQRQLWFTRQADIDVMVSRQTLKRVLLGDEIARTALFLASDDSAMITRQSIVVDAGLL
ncbi:SDR family oxidoreductase [Arsenicitalea aurantiaca]|uniref:SDR family oxidoreductase n=1 Tax=Arsenicitalea aurantiaca TaxID=1783274 RepID=A0A433XAE3_9HYPH|nr:SDR family oxidoreductase [Arsenicitalea aurantiaca]RUT31067.1 SDR family oxidoreductase [Arsenicitalea aurantiaca]